MLEVFLSERNNLHDDYTEEDACVDNPVDNIVDDAVDNIVDDIADDAAFYSSRTRQSTRRVSH